MKNFWLDRKEPKEAPPRTTEAEQILALAQRLNLTCQVTLENIRALQQILDDN